MTIPALAGWTGEQRSVVIASFLGWTLDAFDFFLLVFVIKDIAQEFGTAIPEVTFAILLTLAMRPILRVGEDHRDQYRRAGAHQSHRQRRKGDGLTARFRRLGAPKCMRGQPKGEAADRWVADADEAQQRRRRDVRPAPLSVDIVVAVPIDAVIDAAGSPFAKRENSVLHGRAKLGKPQASDSSQTSRG